MKLIFLVFTFCWVFTSFTVAKNNGKTISSGPLIRSVKDGEKVTIDCNVARLVRPTVTWKKLEGPLPVKAIIKGRFLTIHKFRREYSGTYRCTATNLAGSVNSDVQLFVREKKDSSIRTVNIGDRVEFKCDVDQAFTDIQWTKLEGSLPASGSFERNFIIPIAHREHSGTYRCTATNIAGSVESYVQLVVQGAPISTEAVVQNGDEGDRIVFECVVAGQANVTWTKIEGDLPESAISDGRILIIPKSRKEDSGTYRCLAINKAGSVESHVVQLFVKARPTKLPFFHRLKNPLDIGDVITFDVMPIKTSGKFELRVGRDCCSDMGECLLKTCKNLLLRVSLTFNSQRNDDVYKVNYSGPASTNETFSIKKNQSLYFAITWMKWVCNIRIDDKVNASVVYNYNAPPGTEFIVTGKKKIALSNFELHSHTDLLTTASITDLPTPEKLPFFYRLKKPLVPGDEVNFDVMPTTEIGGFVLEVGRNCCSEMGECLLGKCAKMLQAYIIEFKLQRNGDIYDVTYFGRQETAKKFSIKKNQPFNIKMSWMNKTYEILIDGKFSDTVYYDNILSAGTEFIVSGGNGIVLTNFEFHSHTGT